MPGDPTRRWFDRAFVVPGGLVALGYANGAHALPFWRVTATAATSMAPSPSPASPAASDALVPALTVDHPSVVVTPSQGLTDGQTVSVRVTGFGVGGKVWLSECASVADASDLGCGAQLATQTLLATDDARAGQATFTVQVHAPSRPVVATPAVPCSGQCVIMATVGSDYAYRVAPISFAAP